MKLFCQAYAGTRVLLTGDTGFKGSWLAYWLTRLGAEVTGFALPAEYVSGPFKLARLDRLIRHVDGDVRNAAAVERAVRKAAPRVIFHLAAQSLVRESYRTPAGTAATNILGTVHVLEAVRKLNRPCAVVVVTSDKCYENREQAYYLYRETDRMGGHDLYSASKGCAELLVAAYRRSFFDPGTRVRVATARAGNVFGPGDWAKDRILPDAMRALMTGRPLVVRNPRAVRPWQHVLEPLAAYLWLGARLLAEDGKVFAAAWNFGPRPRDVHTVSELVNRVVAAWGRGRWRAGRAARDPHEAGSLQLAIQKAVSKLNWRPVWNFEEAVRRTVEGYRALAACRTRPERARAVLGHEIEAYVRSAAEFGLPWAGGPARRRDTRRSRPKER